MLAREKPSPHPSRSCATGAASLSRSAGHVLRVACCVSLAAITGCQSARKPPKPKPATKPTATVASGEAVSDAPVRAPGMPGKIIGSVVSIDLRPMGFIATDGYTLPLFAPDGRHFAVQTGAVPDLTTLLARPGQRPPVASRIAMYRLDTRGIVRLGETEGGLILGRSSDANGILVESPRSDGARWIGRVDWGSDEPEWLVQDGKVNAFAVLGPAGQLAYSSHEWTERMFDLVVRQDGRSLRLSGDGVRSYVLPVFNSDGSRVFAISLRDGILELASADPASDESLKQSLVRAFISDRANDETALQMLAPQGARDGVDGRDWLLFHPSLGSLVRWNDADGLRPFQGSVLAAGRIDDRRTAMLIGRRVRIRSVDDDPSSTTTTDAGTVLLDSVAVPRALPEIEGAPSVLLVAPERNGVRLLIARLPR